MTAQAGYWWGGAIAAVILAVVAGVADWRRTRRRSLDDPGWVPWRGIQVAALFAAAAAVILATHR
ncbi:hypothetical protein [Sphingosinicella terrae]|jgi:hypothetical protein|uniref:hypothetical protein n=1 Tax=Sphingosinicella terrae TaxID=2172047 RepID=UPI000E0D6F31|nr:hypothetical protein [Sphingosinicella terrae]